MVDAQASGDYETANVTAGEAIGLGRDVPTAGDRIGRVVAEAETLFKKFSSSAA